MLLSMKQLPTEVQRSFNDGPFVVRLSDGNFNGVWLDSALEVTENKALKDTGGIIGMTMRPDSLARWFLARPIAARYSMIFHDACHGEMDRE